MRRPAFALAAVVLSLPLGSARAQESLDQRIDSRQRTITGYGFATTRLKPDSARLDLGVETTETTVPKVRAASAKAVKMLQDAISALGLKDLTLETGEVAVRIIYPRVDRNAEVQNPRPIGYRIHHEVIVTIRGRDTDRLNRDLSLLIDTALENGANSLKQTVLKDKTDPEFRNLLQEAVRDALANARACAKGAGVDIKQPLSVTHSERIGSASWTTEPWERGGFLGGGAGFGGGEETPIEVGEMEILCRARVVCAF